MLCFYFLLSFHEVTKIKDCPDRREGTLAHNQELFLGTLGGSSAPKKKKKMYKMKGFFGVGGGEDLVGKAGKDRVKSKSILHSFLLHIIFSLFTKDNRDLKKFLYTIL